jgi:hypothetical protein
MVQSPTHIKILQAHSRGHFLEFFQKKFAGKFLAMHLRSRSLTFFNHIFVAQNRPADTKRHFWQPFWTQKSKTRSISDFLVQKVLVLRLFQRARHAVDLSTQKGKQPGKKDCGSWPVNMLSVYRRKMKFFCEVHPQKL